MTTEDVIRVVRRRTTEVDVTLSEWGDDEILSYANDALVRLQVKGSLGLAALTIVSDSNSVDYGISPEPTDGQGMVIAYETAVDILADALQGRLNRGEMGVSWKSGLEEESTAVATQAYRKQIDDLRMEARTLVLALGVGTSATRPL